MILDSIGGMTDRLVDGATVIDIGCGAGVAATAIAEAYPNSTVIGMDPSPHAIEAANERAAAAAGLGNLSFRTGTFDDLDQFGDVDLLLTLDVIHDLPVPELRSDLLGRALAEDGVWMVADIKAQATLDDNLRNPIVGLFYGMSILYCMSSASSNRAVPGSEHLGLLSASSRRWCKRRDSPDSRPVSSTSIQSTASTKSGPDPSSGDPRRPLTLGWVQLRSGCLSARPCHPRLLAALTVPAVLPAAAFGHRSGSPPALPSWRASLTVLWAVLGGCRCPTMRCLGLPASCGLSPPLSSRRYQASSSSPASRPFPLRVRLRRPVLLGVPAPGPVVVFVCFAEVLRPRQLCRHRGRWGHHQSGAGRSLPEADRDAASSR